jgi:2-amino-4-hydroxy-6-hydroxymethyldihydropteridine diphosphokinase
MTDNVFAALGSNKGDKLKYMIIAANEIGRLEGTELVASSSIYETLPWGVKEQENFLNAVIKIRTSLGLTELFKSIKKIEDKLGRTFLFRWGPREIDIDLIFFGSAVFDSEDLTVPHKEALNRDFVLTPLLEIAPDFIHPAAKKPLKELFTDAIEKTIIKKMDIKLFGEKVG